MMWKKKKRICVIGLGHFGSSLSRALASECEVLAIDRNMSRINEIKDDVQRALCLDASDFHALAEVVSPDFDDAIVCIGEALESSILATLHLKKIGIKFVRAKANSHDHADILRSVGASEIIFPELETANRRALQMIKPNLLDFVPLQQGYVVTDFAAHKAWEKHTLVELQLRNRFNIFVLAVKNGDSFQFLPGPNYSVKSEDILTVIGKDDDVEKLHDYIPPEKP